VSITGGTTVSIFDQDVDVTTLRNSIQSEFPDVIVRGISDIRSGSQQGVLVETTASPEELQLALENYLGYELHQENSSIEFTGQSVSQSFYQQLRIAVLVAFFFMALVVFLIFRTPIPSLAVII
jgi:preprotein translocase subunit SecF